MIRKLLRRIQREYDFHIKNPPLVKGRSKVFCVGRNKTGTTSIKRAFEDLGYIVGNQKKAERLLHAYERKDFNKIIRYSKSAQVFQDIPFSYPETFKHLDQAFPGSKFILTIRDNPEQWYKSLTKFHSKIFGRGGRLPTKEDLTGASYVWKGWIWECNRIMYNAPESEPYNKEALIQSYNDYNQSVLDYFSGRPEDLIVINLSEAGSYQKLMDFLKIDSPFSNFPWENRTEKIPIK